MEKLAVLVQCRLQSINKPHNELALDPFGRPGPRMSPLGSADMAAALLCVCSSFTEMHPRSCFLMTQRGTKNLAQMALKKMTSSIKAPQKLFSVHPL